ncbi:MAG TPA: EVE domain-containing protein, partial [Planctomycetota bacterium]|nr:EVE domain-containing protein [Planctomycetota bacterium]
MRVGDLMLFYHSNAKPPGVAGICEVASEAYADPTQFDPQSKYFDGKSDADDPRWMLVDVRGSEELPRFVSLAELREVPELAGMALLRKGQRLSVQPVTAEEFAVVKALAQG